MTGNRSLDEFLGDDGPPSEDADAAGAPPSPAGTETAEEAGNGPRDETADVQPMAPTYARSPDGEACAACGLSTEVSWRDDVGLVCPDCKAW